MAELGNTRRVYIVTGDGNTYTVLKGEQSNSVNRSAESIDVSDKDTGAWGSTMPGKKSFTLDVTVYADNNDEQQKAMLKAFYTDQTVKVFVGKLGEGNTPAEGELFEASILSIGDTNDAGAVATRAMSLASKGAPTLYPEA
jgi:predicted secreted protein